MDVDIACIVFRHQCNVIHDSTVRGGARANTSNPGNVVGTLTEKIRSVFALLRFTNRDNYMLQDAAEKKPKRCNFCTAKHVLAL